MTSFFDLIDASNNDSHHTVKQISNSDEEGMLIQENDG
jgi:hypothetical protein